ncbi:cytochrome c oxidase assembly protein [Microbacterium sediminis]|uniref:cytochrome c oxidase assembly protein n=1 Tax=Microbacterium sediminis TaxID=904291 RepID=UPI001072E08F|nr:cytochrome c oxidase assembly protein [Microbacterium sediminis]QBR73172.1 copper transporter [Microbacterium sediminis]
MTPRLLRAAGPAILVLAALAAAVWALAFAGGADPLTVGDPGPVIRWGLPVAKLLVNLSAAAMIGALVVALWALRAGEREFDVALDTASIGAAVFTVASGTVTFFTFLSVFNPQLSAGPEFGAQLGRFLVDTELGRAWLLTTIAAAAVTVLAFAVRGWIPTLVTAILAAASLIPMATQGHSGDLASHGLVVTALAIHILGAAVWLGGLVLIVVVRPVLAGDRVRTVLERYSTIALAAFVVVAASGVLRSLAAIASPLELVTTPYGVVLSVKIVALIAMGLLGAWYRLRLIATHTSGVFWRVVTLELALMGIASGAAAALARSAPPVGEEPPTAQTPAEILTGEPLPPELTPIRLLTEWDIDPLWLLAGAFGIALYLAGVWRLRRRGDHWPVYRTVLWVLGMLLLVWVTNGALNAYGHTLFSMHMLMHMLLSMAIPLLLVPGAPVTLAARAIPKREDGSRGGREWILWIVHNPVAKVLTHPLVAAGIFIGSLWLFYFSELFRWSLYDHLGHEWMVTHFLISGYLFVMSLVGIDPVPYRLPHAGRLVTLIVVMAMHAFFGIAIMSQSGLMVAEWYGAMGRTWGATPLEDQYAGGGIAWSIGEIPTLITAITVAIQWSRSDERQQRRRDRHADRTGDAELDAYNARLAALAERDRRAGV